MEIKYFENREDWRKWLADNFENASDVWFVFPSKFSGEKSVTYNDVVEEALCFGWIDSTIKALDKEHKIQHFTPRNPKSSYSQANKERLKWLLEHNMIHPDREDNIRKVLSAPFVFPNDIIGKLKEDKTVWENYQQFSDAYRRIRIAYIEAARKRPEEFEKRLNMYKAFEMLGYDAETLGNHEFNYGLEFLDRMVKAAKINIINANVRNAQTGDYYYNPYKIVNKTFTDTDGKWKVVNSKAKLEKNDTKSDIADKDLIDMAAYDHNGPSTQAGFAEYRLSVKEKANQVDDTTNKESEKSPKGVETTDQSKREISKATVVASVAKPAPASQLSNAQVVILPQAQVQETQGLSSVKALPNTGSDESVSVTLAGLILMTLARCFGIKKHEKIKQEKKPLSGLFCSCFTN